jgi:pimeloyl-ACP methyl ester carboxylesterase
MSEEPLNFGESGALFGILSLPDDGAAARLPVLIPNTGVDPRSGPGRMHVELARALAALGHPVLRMDLAGLGDSEILPGRMPESPAPELRAAIDLLAARGYGERFAIIGFGSGAHAAHETARADPRVIGAAFLDGYRYPTVRHWLRRLIEGFTGGQPADVLRDDPQPHYTPRSGDALHDVPTREVQFYRQPSQKRMQADLIDFMQRGLALCYLYTGQIANDYGYARQLVDAFPILRGYRRLSLQFLPRADHRFGRRINREAMIVLLRDWLATVA